MTEKDLRKLSRAELLEMLLAQSQENEELHGKLKEAEEKQKELEELLEDRRITIENAGSLAEASLQLNGVFEAAQKACDQYAENIRELSMRQERICAQMEQVTKLKCDRMMAEAKQQSEAYWVEVQAKIKEITASYADLRQIWEGYPHPFKQN